MDHQPSDIPARNSTNNIPSDIEINSSSIQQPSITENSNSNYDSIYNSDEEDLNQEEWGQFYKQFHRRDPNESPIESTSSHSSFDYRDFLNDPNDNNSDKTNECKSRSLSNSLNTQV